jgi:hypothetical protein
MNQVQHSRTDDKGWSSSYVIGGSPTVLDQEKWRSEIHLCAFFVTLAQDGVERSALCSSRFVPGVRTPGTNSLGRSVSPRAGMDSVEKKIFFATAENLTPIPRSSNP